MARTTGPLHSDAASGTLAGSLVFSQWNGRTYVRQHVKPKNPKSAAQVGIRVMHAWLAHRWTTYGAWNKATWQELATAKAITPLNAMVQENLNRWQINKGPTIDYPADEIEDTLDPDAIGDGGVILTADAFKGYALLYATPDNTAANDASVAVLYRAAAAPTPKNWRNAIAVLPVVPSIAWTYIDRKLAPGTYHYKLAYNSVDGCFGPLSAADAAAVVT
jgi:hypothetical protein